MIDHYNKSCTLPGLAGKVISSILEAGFEISMLEMFNMEKANAEEFYEVYKGVVQEYGSMVAELTSGPCLAMEIRAQNAPQAFREMVGPSDPVRINVLIVHSVLLLVKESEYNKWIYKSNCKYSV